MYIRQDIQRERIAGCGSEVGANIDSVKGNREEGVTGMEEMSTGGVEGEGRGGKVA